LVVTQHFIKPQRMKNVVFINIKMVLFGFSNMGCKSEHLTFYKNNPTPHPNIC
jgi:hypothetical protein